MDGHSPYRPGARYFYRDHFAFLSPTPSPRGPSYYDSTPQRPATRAHLRHMSSGMNDYSSPRLAAVSPRYTSQGLYSTSQGLYSTNQRANDYDSHEIKRGSQRPQRSQPASTHKAPSLSTTKATESSAVALSLAHASYQARKRRFLPVKINGKPVYALPDTGVASNVISEDYALTLGATIEQPHAKHRFMNAKDHFFESVGTTSLTVSIPGSLSNSFPRRELTCSFAVVKCLAAPLVLGNQFLLQTEALTSFAHLMVKRTLSVVSDRIDKLKKVWMFMHMNLPTQKLRCSLDSEPAFAALDTGADIDVVSLEYATRRKWELRALPEGEGYVLLANKEIVKLAGYVETTVGIQGGCINKKLYVLDGLVCEIVLGDPTIEGLNIFNKFQSSIVDTIADEDMDRFHLIEWVEMIDHDLEQLLASGPDDTTSGRDRRSCRSFFRNRALRKGKSAKNEEIVKALRDILNDLATGSTRWRWDTEDKLSRLTGDEFTRKKNELDEVMNKCNQIRDEIQHSIDVRLQRSMTEPSLESGQGGKQHLAYDPRHRRRSNNHVV